MSVYLSLHIVCVLGIVFTTFVSFAVSIRIPSRTADQSTPQSQISSGKSILTYIHRLPHYNSVLLVVRVAIIGVTLILGVLVILIGILGIFICFLCKRRHKQKIGNKNYHF